MQCPKCSGKGKIIIRKPINITEMGETEQECSLCQGTGELYEDMSPRLVVELEKLVELQSASNITLEKILEKLSGGNK
jgi:hypothetical protein